MAFLSSRGEVPDMERNLDSNGKAVKLVKLVKCLLLLATVISIL